MNRNLTILIIEDDPNDVVLLKRALSRENINNPVQVVHDGKEALHYLQGEGKYHDRTEFPFPSVIFTDLKMPRMSGFDVLDWLKKHPECSVIPLIILSASKMEADVRKAYQMGANAYLVKPGSIGELQEMVKTAYNFWALCEKPPMSGKC
jgi:CheY-like chemotaxis protein